MDMSRAKTLVVWYDRYHTPLDLLADKLPGFSTYLFDVGDLAPAGFEQGAGEPAVERVDGIQHFVEMYVSRAIKANARYQAGYNLSSALAVLAIAELCARIVEQQGFGVVVHGFAGNDQLRFETAIATLCPSAKVCSTVELIGSRTAANSDGCTLSRNIWGTTLESGEYADPWVSSTSTPFPEQTGDSIASELEIEFMEGLPIGLNGERMALVDVVQALNKAGSRAKIGQRDIVEDGMVGLKSRALYFSPAADILLEAHRDLAYFTASRRQNLFTPMVESAWSQLVYDGGWFDPFRQALDAYIDEANRYVSGVVRIRAGAGGAQVQGRCSLHGLYDEEQAIYRAGQDINGELLRGLRDQQALIYRLSRSVRRTPVTNGGL